MVDIAELKEKFLNLEFDRKGFNIEADQVLSVAKHTGETRAEYTDPDHPDFQAPPAVLASLASGRQLPIDFPSLGGISMDGGKAVQVFAPVRPGTPLTGRTHLHEIYDKAGRSGRMVFLVSRMELFDEEGTLLATADSRQVIREMPQ